MLLRKFCGIEKTDNGYLIHGDAGDIKLVFIQGGFLCTCYNCVGG